MEKQETSIIYGKNAVTETLTSGREIDTVYVQKGASLGKILALAKKSGAVVKEVSDEKMTAMCGTPKHGGTAAELASASYSTVEDILAAAEEKGKPPFIIIADEIEDPHNLGAIIRTAEAAGADGLIIEVHNDPMKALCDGAQSLRPEQYDELAKKVRRVREVVNE